jgi:ABC-type antimicrobial peptide transport system permease subunit
MDTRENILQAFTAIKGNRLRAILTILIIAFGIMSIVGVLTAIDGIKASMENSFTTSSHSSFLFKTYEYNDRKIVEKHITKKNKCIIIGGGIGFIATLAFHLSNQKILVFEINNKRMK